MNYRVQSKKKHSVTIDLGVDYNKVFEVAVDKTNHAVEIRKIQDDGTLKTLMIDNRVVPVEVERRGDGMPVRVYLKGVPYDVEISKMASTRYRPPEQEAAMAGAVRASLPGQIVSLLVNEGDRVEAGAPIVILDAMKMENEIAAPKTGIVSKVEVQSGQIIAKGDLILEID
ncbi:MAG: biotin/lipoyl-containing protein [Opitutales bacterium]